ncbi:MAG: hypothetical protein M3346_06340 [Actinomycetota bacterium]|nr:hypothetical protein [Actinomycetota bacterium]
MTAQDLPIACSLNGSEVVRREQEWKKLLAGALVERSAIPGGVELRFGASPQTASQLRRLIELEKECCGWIQWAIAEEDGLVVEATASQDQGVRLLNEWVGAGHRRA